MSGRLRWLTWFVGVTCGVVALLWGDARVARAGDAADSTMDIVQYRAPSGWTPTNANDPARRVYSSPDATASQQAVIMLTLSGQQNKVDLRSAFDGAAKELTKSGKITQSTDVTSTKTRQGFEAMAQAITVETSAGAKLYVRLVCANVNNRVAAFCYVASPQSCYDKHMPDMDALLASVSFAAAKGPAAAAGPAAGPVAAGGVPVRDEAAAIAQAVGQFNKTVDKRRKPHTVAGDILTLDGKPIPNVVTATVSVGGVSIAAERTHYTLAVDKAGHFEQKIPDGLYRLSPKVVVNLNGHQTPVDLVPVDAGGARVDQSSAEGIVQDFRLVLGALDPLQDPNRPESYLGGVVHLNDPTYTPQSGEISHRHAGAKIRFTFVPLTPAVDGSKIDPFAVDVEAGKVHGYRLGRLPLAAYRVSAALAMPDGSTPALTCSLNMIQSYGNAVELNWDGQAEYNTARVEQTIYVRD